MVSFLLERSDHIQWPYCDARQLQRRQARQNSQQEESRAASLSTTAAASLRRTRSDIKRTRRETLPSTGSNNSKMAPRVGFEPTTLRLTAGCSAVELPRNFFGALRFLGARKYYRHFNFRRNPLFQIFFQQPISGGTARFASSIRKRMRTLRFHHRAQPTLTAKPGKPLLETRAEDPPEKEEAP